LINYKQGGNKYMKILNIGVNDGHTISGFGTGAVGIIVEGEHTRLVGTEVRRLIKEAGHNAINCTVDYASSVNESLSKILDQANRQDLDWFIAIHFNAGGGLGIETYTYGGRQYQDALDVCSNIAKLGFRNRGVKDGKGLYVIRKTVAKSMLIEVCFVDTEDADHYLQVGYKAIAKAIVEGILGTLVVAPVAIPVKVATSGEIYRVRKTWADTRSQIGAFADLENAKIYVNEHPGYVAYNSSGVQAYPIIVKVVTNQIGYKTVMASVLNVRAGQGTNFGVVGQLKQGDKVRVDQNFKSGWTSIYFGDHGGFVSTQYLK